MMNESFLHYVWQFQYFDKTDLATQGGESLQVFQPGIYNTNAGPDFSGARIKIETLEWNGSVELHIRSSDWEVHQHQHDHAYDNVVLHVVWVHDKELAQRDGSAMPTLELRGRVYTNLIHQYTKLMASAQIIPCQKLFAEVPEITRLSALEKALVQRLEIKATLVSQLLAENEGDWEETTYQVLARNFGFKINSEPFLDLSKALPYRILRKHSNQLLQVEALLFGQSGMLVAKSQDEYLTSLINEFEFLRHKYALPAPSKPYTQWKFLRLRPANFPTLRLAQFAKLMAHTSGIFSRIIEVASAKEIAALFQIETSSYWQSHYRFGKKATGRVPSFGGSSFHNVVINSVVPILMAYGKFRDDDRYHEIAMELLQHLPAEQNRITRIWTDLGLPIKTAFDSQASIELYNNFCQKKNCLQCTIGSSLLRPQKNNN